jgi:ankyrin repeat protein
MTAAGAGRVGSIKVLLQYGARLQATESYVRNNSPAGATGSLLWQTGDTALHKAGWRGMVATVETLLENGADVHATNKVAVVMAREL